MLEICRKIIYNVVNKSKLMKGRIIMGDIKNSKEYTPEQVKENIKRNIAALRIHNGLKKRDVANALGIKENTYRIWEDPSRSCPKPHDIVKLAAIYNVSCDFILNDNETAPANQVACDSEYNVPKKKTYLTELDSFEKLLVMKARRLSPAGKQKIGEELSKLLEEEEA